MQGIELSPQELAYLLAVVHATAVVGVDDPELFPTTAKQRDSVYGAGRKQLEKDEWIVPLEDHDDEYDLNAGLVQLVAVIAGPEHVIATVRSDSDDSRQAALHYLFGSRIVELWNTPEKRYLLGLVDDRQALLRRIAELLQVPEQSDQASFTLPEAAFQKALKFSKDGNRDKLEAQLKAAGEHAEQFSADLAEPEGGQLFVVQPSGGEIQGGRRATVVAGKWIAFRRSQDTKELEISSLDTERLESLLDEWLE